jgi:2-pyrone-4,6-dicarboxylate lactonase
LPPPHPDPHPPRRLDVPVGACDVHCHIFGPFDRFPIPAGASYHPAETPLERYRIMADRLGLTRAVFVQPAIYGVDHWVMLDAIARGGGRYAGVGIVADDSDVAALHAGGLRGARFNFVGHLGVGPSREMVERTAVRVAPLGWHLVFHVDEVALLDQADWLACLNVPVVIDHMARLNAGEGTDTAAFRALVALARLPHVWVKISAADRMCADGDLSRAVPFMAALVEAAPSRTLWGTDWPHPNVGWMPDDGDLIDLLALCVPEWQARHAILVDNPARLYSFS